jgi:LPS-assembly protein
MTRILATIAALFLVVFGTSTVASAQSRAAVLIADRVALDGRDRLVAQGHVEVLYQDVRLKAARIEYHRPSEKLIIDGPIVMTDGAQTVILAGSGELDSTLENGLMRGARMIMDQRLQLAANQLDRTGGRYTQLYKVAATSCRVCDDDTPPVWQIRAKRTIHDEQEKRLYFENAQFRVLDVPIMWLPRLRLPDPSVTRATGFLIPSLKQSSDIGLGVKIPYFIRLGDHRDITLTPFFSPQTKTLEWRYRQALRTGRMEFNGALSNDSLQSGELRGFIFGQGLFTLKNDYQLSFEVEAVTDRAYLLDYDYSDKDRLESEVALSRTSRDQHRRAALSTFQTLRVGEDNETMPSIILDAEEYRRYFPARLGGEVRLSFGAHTHYRDSDVATDGPDADIWGDGRDVTRAQIDAKWLRNWMLPGGIRAEFMLGGSIDSFWINQDAVAAVDQDVAFTPQAALTLRWPWLKTSTGGVVHVVEPVMMLGWVGGDSLDVPNDESTRVEFDEGNLLSLSHFPAPDRRERGAAGAIGVNWTRSAPSGWNAALTLGQVVREDSNASFSASSGLAGITSDMLIAGQIQTVKGLNLTARTLLGRQMDVNKAEARAQWQNQRSSLGLSYVWLGADPAEDRSDTISEWALDGSHRLAQHWTGTVDWRYDLADNRATQASLGLRYLNECVEMNVSLSRRFTSSTIVEPSTNFGFTVSLKGFSANGAEQSHARSCRN